MLLLEEKHYSFLLEEYRKIWNNRLLALSDEKTCEQVLKDAVRRELLDENSHPRIRKDSYTKFYMAVKRIMESSLDNGMKVELILLHTDMMDVIKDSQDT